MAKGLDIELYAALQLGPLPMRLSSRMGASGTVFEAHLGDKSLGDMLRYLVGLARPDWTLELTAPWNVLDNISLRGLVLSLDVTGGRVGFSYSDIGLDLGFIRVDKLELWYQSASRKAKRSVDLKLYGLFLGQDYTEQPLGWDVLNQPPPPAPTAGKRLFQLDYLGLGQHVTLRDRSAASSMARLIDALANSYREVEGADPMKSLPTLMYDAESSWLVGTRFTVLETVTLAAVFNDPSPYGLYVALDGPRARALAGLRFEIVYRQVTDTVGVYHIALTLPSAMRKIEIGAASVTLPELVLDIYTNGNFRIDLGFPYRMDFTRSFQIEMMVGPVPVIGAGGFYFAVLDSQTSSDVPRIGNGQFAPVIAFGLGLRLGVGKNFNAGILSAGISLTLDAALEGVLGFFQPSGPGVGKDLYYRVSGTVAITGHVYGRVDFGIISASVDLWARAAAGITLESYGSALVTLEASVSASVSVKIVFFRISLSFGITVHHTVEIGQRTQPPWTVLAEAAPAGARLAGPRNLSQWRRLARPSARGRMDLRAVEDERLLARVRAEGLQWRGVAVGRPPTLNLYFHPLVTVGMDDDHPKAALSGAPPAPAVMLDALLLIDAGSGAPGTPSPFEQLAQALLRWAGATLHRSLGTDPDPLEVRRSHLQAIYDDLVQRGGCEPIAFCDLMDFLRLNFRFTIRALPKEAAAQAQAATREHTVFPIFPTLELHTSDGAHRVDFRVYNPCSAAYRQAVAAYYDQLSMQSAQARQRLRRAASASCGGGDLSMASFVFVDYFVLILRQVVQAALSLFEDWRHEAAEGDTLAQIAARFGEDPQGAERLAWANAGRTGFYATGTTLRVVTQRDSVREGEALDALCERLGLSHGEFAARFQALPMLAAGATLRVAGARYVLRADDTPWQVAQRFGCTTAALVEANPDVPWPVPVTDFGPVPAGWDIAVPTVDWPIGPDRTLLGVAQHFGLGPTVLLEEPANQRNPALLATGAPLEVGTWAVAHEGESIDALARRSGADPAMQALMLSEQVGACAVGAQLLVAGGTWVLRADDSLERIAEIFGVGQEALLAANPGFDWAPAPYSGQLLPAGKTIELPTCLVRLGAHDTLRAVAHRFSLPLQPFLACAAVRSTSGVLAAGAYVPVPPFDHVVQAGETLLGIAQRHALGVLALGLANAGPQARFGTVVIPLCDKMEVQTLEQRLQAQGAYRAPAQAVARFLLHGLRLPDPAHYPFLPADDAPPMPDLYPLYNLTGQQWPVPDSPGPDYRITLGLDDLAAAARGEPCEPPDITFESPLPNQQIAISLAPEDLALIAEYRKLIIADPPFDPRVLALTRQPPFARSAITYNLGQPVYWRDGGATGGSIAMQQVFVLPEPLLRQAGACATKGVAARVLLDTSTATDSLNVPPAPLQDWTWSTRIDIGLQHIADPMDGGRVLPNLYEVSSGDAQSRSRLLALLRLLWPAPPGLQLRIDLLYTDDPAAGNGPGLVSDALDHSLCSLIKANLSTETRPPGRALLDHSAVALASLAEPLAFATLLWEACITNSGGYYLHYQVAAGAQGEGLPDALFTQQGRATLAVLLTVQRAGDGAPFELRGFHNVLVSAHAVDIGRASLLVAGPVGTVAPEQSLEDLARIAGRTVGELAAANATTPGLLRAGVLLNTAQRSYATQPGDDLLCVALALQAEWEELVTLVAPRKELLQSGASLTLDPAWTTATPTLQPGQVGVRMLCVDPDPAADAAALQALPPDRQLAATFNLLGNAVLAGDGFRASTEGLPAAPARPLAAGSRAESDPPIPWLFTRVLPVAELVVPPVAAEGLPRPEGVNPYGGVGRTATIGLQRYDVGGNRCQPPERRLRHETRVYYTDALYPPSQWPGVTAGYAFAKGNAGPQLHVMLAFDSGRYAAAPDRVFDPGVAAADLERHRRIGFQLAQDEVSFHLGCSFDVAVEVDRAPTLDFLVKVRQYVATLAAMRPVRARVHDAGGTLQAIAARHQVDLRALAGANEDNVHLLRADATLRVPATVVVMPNDSLALLATRAGAPAVTVVQLAQLNAGHALQPGLRLRAGGAAHLTKAGDTLDTVASILHVSLEKLATDSAQVPGLFEPGSLVLLRLESYPVQEGQSLADVAATVNSTVAALAQANADDARLLQPAAEMVIPGVALLGDYRAATLAVVADDTFQALADRSGRPLASLARANQCLAALLVPGSRWGCGKLEIEVRDNDCLGSLLARVQQLPDCAAMGVGALVAGNKDRKGLLREGAHLLLPPPAGRFLRQLAPKFDQVILPLVVTWDITRGGAIDPLMRELAGVATASATLRPLAAQAQDDGQGTLDLKALARNLQQVFGDLRLATGSATEDSATLTLVSFQGHLAYRILSVPSFFAVPPLATELWIPPPGTGGTPGAVDLDTWGRRFLATLDGLLTPTHAPAVVALGPALFQQLADAKQALATSISARVAPVLEPPEGTPPPTDLQSAVEAMRDRLRVRLSAAYETQALVQYPVYVVSPFGPQQADICPRLVGRITGATRILPADATLQMLAQELQVSLSALAQAAADLPYLLTPGFELAREGRPPHCVDADDTLRSAARALDWSPRDLATAYARTPGLLRAGADLGLVLRTHRCAPLDSLRTVLLSLAPGVATMAELLPLLEDFLAVNADTPGLLETGFFLRLEDWVVVPGESLHSVGAALGVTAAALAWRNANTGNLLRAGCQIESVTVEVGQTLATVARELGHDVEWLCERIAARTDVLVIGASLLRPQVVEATVRQDESLADLAARMQCPLQQLVLGAFDLPDLPRREAEWRLLARQPGFSISNAKIRLVDAGSAPAKAWLTFGFDLASNASAQLVTTELRYQIHQVEHAIENVSEVAGYQSSSWLSLVDGIDDDSLPTLRIPVPLKSYPLPTSFLSQQARPQWPSTRDPAQATLADIRTWAYRFSYAYAPAAQDELTAAVEINLPRAEPTPLLRGPSTELPYALQAYIEEADALDGEFAQLPGMLTHLSDSQGAAPLEHALRRFVTHAEAIALAWADWRPPQPPEIRGPTLRLAARDLVPGGAAMLRAGRAQAGPIPALVAHRRLRAPLIPGGSLPGAGEIGTDGVYTHELAHQDLLFVQNACGSVSVARNHGLMPGRRTNPAFVYRCPPQRASTPTGVGLRWDAPFDMASVPPLPGGVDALHAQLAGFFAELLVLKPDDAATEHRRITLSVSYAVVATPVDEAEVLHAPIPLRLQPTFTFAAADLLAPTGFCARLAQDLQEWLRETRPEGQRALWIFTLSLFGTLDGVAVQQAPVLLEMSDVRLAVDRQAATGNSPRLRARSSAQPQPAP